MSQDVCWLFSTVLLLVGSLTLLIAAYAVEENGVATAVIVLTLLVAIPSLLSLILQQLMDRQWKRQHLLTDAEHDSGLLTADDTDKMLNLLTTGLRPTSTFVSFYFGPAIALFVVIMVRLAASPINFEGDPSTLDFGPKDGVENGEPNVAFTPEFNSYGHCLQGVLGALLMFPAVSGVLTQLLTCKFREIWSSCNAHVWNLIHVTAVCMCIYPTYNLTKRLIRSSESFATSSFCNNGFEWAVGFMSGLAFGNCISVLVKRAVLQQILNDKLGRESWLLGTQEPPTYQPRVNGFICIMGIVFMITVFVASVFFGLSWHSCPDGQDDCVNYSDEGISTEVLAVMLLIPTVIITVVSCGECMRLRR